MHPVSGHFRRALHPGDVLHRLMHLGVMELSTGIQLDVVVVVIPESTQVVE